MINSRGVKTTGRGCGRSGPYHRGTTHILLVNFERLAVRLDLLLEEVLGLGSGGGDWGRGGQPPESDATTALVRGLTSFQ